MSIRFPCPHCQAVYNLADTTAGKKMKCARCGNVVRVGAPAPVDSSGSFAGSGSSVISSGEIPSFGSGSSSTSRLAFPSSPATGSPFPPSVQASPSSAFPVTTNSATSSSGPQRTAAPVKKKQDQTPILMGIAGLVAVVVGVVVYFAISGGVPVVAQSKEAKIKMVQADMCAMIKAQESRDVETVLNLTHPRLFELAGGKEKLRTDLKALFAMSAQVKVKTQVSFPNVPNFVTGSKNEFVFVPMKVSLSASSSSKGKNSSSTSQKTGEMNSMVLGIRSRGTTRFKYIEGTRVTRGTIRELFPDFPVSKFPEYP